MTYEEISEMVEEIKSMEKRAELIKEAVDFDGVSLDPRKYISYLLEMCDAYEFLPIFKAMKDTTKEMLIVKHGFLQDEIRDRKTTLSAATCSGK